ncbi:hypothetical protein J4439_03915 [Candidatus Woesearchaeota archaeon]|nr:hypothetical protein [Candidatus Woesearchaeota archaeon]
MARILLGMLLLTLIACSQGVTNSEGETVRVERLPADAPVEQRVAQLEKLSYRVTYEMTMQSDEEPVMLEVTQYVDSAGNMRQDGEMRGERVRQYVLDGKGYACLSSGSRWACSSASADMQDVGSAVRQASQQYQLPPAGARDLAGTEAACYALTTGIAEVEYCFSPEGVPLLVSTAAGSFLMEMRATSYSLGVRPEDFELPAQPSGSFEDEESVSVSVEPNCDDWDADGCVD